MAKRNLTGDLASRYASAILRHSRSLAFAAEEIDAYGAPGECMALAARSIDKELIAAKRLLRREARMSERAMERAVRARVSTKSAYVLGL